MANLREFRHAVSVLKKQGLLPDKLSQRKKLDARSVTPDLKIKGKKLSTLVEKYDDVVSGKATAVTVPPSKLKAFRKLGFETAQGKVVVPHSKGEVAKLKAGEISIRNRSGVERVQLPVEYHNLRQYLSDIRKNEALINKMKHRNEYFGIRFYGGQRANFYRTIGQLMNDLERYESIETVSGKAKQAEVYRNLEILRMTPHAAEKLEVALMTRRKKMTKEYNRQHAKKQRAKLKRFPAKLAKAKEASAERSKAYRERLKSHPAKLKEYKEAASERAKKSQAKAKKVKRAKAKAKKAKKAKRKK